MAAGYQVPYTSCGVVSGGQGLEQKLPRSFNKHSVVGWVLKEADPKSRT